MPWLYDKAKYDLETIHDSIAIKHAVCPCYERFTTIVNPMGRNDQTLTMVKFHASIRQDTPSPEKSFVPGHSQRTSCAHELVTEFDFIVDIRDQDRFQMDKPMLLYNAKVQTDFETLTVDLRDEKSGFLDWFGPEDFSEKRFHGDTVIRVAELFSGSFSGWSQSVAAIDLQGLPMQHVWSLDYDFRVAESYGKSHGSCVMVDSDDARRHIGISRQFLQDPKMIFLTDIRNGWFLKHIDRNLHMFLMSPPCQPFSLAFTAEGFNREDGRSMAWAWGVVSAIRPKVVCLEEVANFEMHPDFRIVQDIITWAGYQIVCKKSINLGDVLPQNRNRFVMIAFDKHAEGISKEFAWLMWPKVVGQTLRSSRCFLDLDVETLKKYQPDTEVLQQYLDPKNLPKDPRENPRKRNRIESRKYRIRTWDDSCFSCIMANYSRGHLLPKSVIESGGIYGSLFLQDDILRFLSPFEVVMLMGCVQDIVIPSDHAEQMRMLGNSIAVPHALITIINGLSLLNVTNGELDGGLMFSQVMRKRIRCDTISWKDDGEFIFISKREEDFFEVALTQSMKSFVPMVIKAPTTEVFCEAEQGVLVGHTLQLMTGQSCPNVVEQEVCGGFKIPITPNDRVGMTPVTLHVGVPSILALSDDDFRMHDSPVIRILTAKGSIVMRREDEFQVGCVLKTISEFFPELIRSGGLACNGLGEPFNFDEVCPNCIVYVDPIPEQVVNIGAFDGNHFQRVGRQLEMKGELRELQIIIQTFADLRILQSCQSLGWNFHICPEWDGSSILYKIVFSAMGERLSIPFQDVIAFLQTRLMISWIPQCIPLCNEGNVVHVKLWNKWIWKGKLANHVTLDSIIKPWRLSTTFLGESSELRIVIKGKSVSPDLAVGQVVDGGNDLKIFLVLSLHGGGNKDDANVKCRSDLAVVLLQHGADVHQTSAFVDTAVRSAGIQAISQIIKMASADAKIDALRKLSKSLHIQWPDSIRSDEKRNAKVQNKLRQKGVKAIPNITADQFSLITDGFENEDGSKPALRNNIVPGASGIVLMDPSIAKHWIQDQKIISSDEQALLVLGHDCPSDNHRCCKKVQVAAIASNHRPVVLAACLHNLGQKKITYGMKEPGQVVTQDTVTLAFTVFRDEFNHVDWATFVNQPVKFVMQTLCSPDDAFVSPPWGRSWFAAGVKSKPHEASSLQFHARIERSKTENLLKLSGTGGVYITPKTIENVADPDFSIVWLDEPVVDLLKLLGEVPHHMGLVRVGRGQGEHVRYTRGIRCKRSDFTTVFSQLRPQDDVPSIKAVRFLYKVQPTPVGATAETVSEWMGKMNWDGRPIKALGDHAWLIGSEAVQNQQFLLWSSKSVLIKPVQSRHKQVQSAIVAGFVPKEDVMRESQQDVDILQTNDPWSKWKPNVNGDSKHSSSGLNSQSTGPRQVEAPIENRFKKQEEQLSSLEKAVKDLQTNASKQDQAMVKFESHMSSEITSIRAEVANQFDQMTSTFDSSLEKALLRQQNQVNAGFAELKSLILNRPTPQKKAKTAPPKNGEELEGEMVEQDGNL